MSQADLARGAGVSVQAANVVIDTPSTCAATTSPSLGIWGEFFAEIIHCEFECLQLEPVEIPVCRRLSFLSVLENSGQEK